MTTRRSRNSTSTAPGSGQGEGPERPRRSARRRSLVPKPFEILAIAGLILGIVGVAVFAWAWLSPNGPLAQRTPSKPSESTSSVVPTGTVEPTATPEPTSVVLPFDASKAMAHIEYLSSTIGTRKEGSSGETEAADYAAAAFREMGYTVEMPTFELPNGKTSRNVIATRETGSDVTIVIGGHMDSKLPSPGANDNASGCGVTLELARDFAGAGADSPSMVFVLFGAEEMSGSDGNLHHFGSRAMAGTFERYLDGMISVDMVGVGDTFQVRQMDGPTVFANALIASAKKQGIKAVFARDPGKSGWSDHEPFERAGIPAAWIELADDPYYHTARDTFDKIEEKRIRQTGEWLHAFLTETTTARWKAFRAK